MTLPDTADFTSTFTSGCTFPTSVTFTCTSATSAFPVFTGGFASGLFAPFAFIATKTPTTTTARMIEKIQTFFRFFGALMPLYSDTEGNSCIERCYKLTAGRAGERHIDDMLFLAALTLVSGLQWHTDLEEAKRAAVREGKPILSLRLPGN